MRSTAPYDITHVSYPFRLVGEYDDDLPTINRDRIQFAVGLARSREDPAKLTLSYGVGDCVAAEVNVTVADVWSMLQGSLVKLKPGL